MGFDFGLILAIAFGAIFGSYATLFAHRLPIGQSCFGRYFGNRSSCPKCKKQIKTRDLIPLLNWLITRGKCRFCGSLIPKTHLFIEVATTAIFAVFYLKFSFSESFILHSLIGVGLIILISCEYTHKKFPKEILIFLLVIGVIHRTLIDQNIIGMIYSGVLGVICSTVFYQIFYKKAKALFANHKHSLSYTKLVLISSLILQQIDFLIYYLVVILTLTIILAFNIANRKNRNSFSYVLIIPLLWALIS